MRIQSVHVGKTQSGTIGFFTGNTIAFHWREEWLERARLEEGWDLEYIKALAARLGFEFDGTVNL